MVSQPIELAQHLDVSFWGYQSLEAHVEYLNHYFEWKVVETPSEAASGFEEGVGRLRFCG